MKTLFYLLLFIISILIYLFGLLLLSVPALTEHFVWAVLLTVMSCGGCYLFGYLFLARINKKQL